MWGRGSRLSVPAILSVGIGNISAHGVCAVTGTDVAGPAQHQVLAPRPGVAAGTGQAVFMLGGAIRCHKSTQNGRCIPVPRSPRHLVFRFRF